LNLSLREAQRRGNLLEKIVIAGKAWQSLGEKEDLLFSPNRRKKLKEFIK